MHPVGLRGKIVENRLPFARQFLKSLHVFELAPYFTIEFESFFEAGALLQKLAGAFLIGPEVGFRDLLQQLVQLALLGIGVKETSALPRCGI